MTVIGLNREFSFDMLTIIWGEHELKLLKGLLTSFKLGKCLVFGGNVAVVFIFLSTYSGLLLAPYGLQNLQADLCVYECPVM